MKKPTIAILGAGITGLVSGYYLSKDYNVILIEKENFIGGTAQGFKYKDFTLDLGPHKLYTELPGIMEEIEKLIPLIKIKKKNSIYLNGNYYDFPLKITQVALKMPLTGVSAGIDIITKGFSKLSDDSYENYLINRFGKTLYNLSFKDYALKVWNSSPQELDSELARRRVAISSIFQLIKGMLFKDTKQISAEYFYYPKGGIKSLLENIADKIEENGGKILLNDEIKEIKIKDNKISFIKLKNSTLNPDYVISTIPLDSLSLAMSPKISFDSKLFYQDLNVLYFILHKPRALKDCWIFFPENKFIFQRVSEQKAFLEDCCPSDKTVLMVETTKNINSDLVKEIISQLEQVGILKKEEIAEYFYKTLKKAYPIYKKGFLEGLNSFISNIEKIDNFYLLGRQGLFNYNNMDQCWDMGMKIASQIKNRLTKEDWQNTKKYFDSYRIVD